MKKALLILYLLFPVFLNAQPSTDILLFTVSLHNNEPVISGATNITNHKGYDNQPSFHPTQPLLYYASFNDSGRSDIKYYNYKTKQTVLFTNTNEREYSPTLTPDGKFISCIIQRDNGAQDLGKYPINGGAPLVLVNNLKVGYHYWITESSLLLFILDDSVSNSLRHYNLLTKKDSVLLKNPGRCIQNIPGQNAISFVEKKSKEEWLLKKYDNKTGAISNITTCLTGREDYCWLNSNIVLMSNGNLFFYLNITNSKGWQPVKIEMANTSFKGITRLAYQKKSNLLAVAMNE
jgi:WD40-like Beta Propeller Repeat